MNLVRNILTFISRIFFVASVLGLVIYLFFIFTSGTRFELQPIQDSSAQNQEMYKSLAELKKKNKKVYTAYKNTLCFIVGDFCTDNSADSNKHRNNSLVGIISSMIALPYLNPPASGAFYITETLANSGLIPQAYAAEGIGFSSLRPFLSLWKVFRDLAYLLLVVILILIGFMVMFRMKLDPQTVISVESALPKIVITLILITFSYAIAGFLIDLMYALILIVIALIGSRGNFYDVAQVQSEYINAGANKIIPRGFFSWPQIGIITSSFVNILPIWVNQIVRTVIGAFVGYWAFTSVSGPVYRVINPISDVVPFVGPIAEIILKLIVFFVSFSVGFSVGYSAVLPIIIFLILVLTVVFLFFRIFFLLFFAYIKILIFVIFAPIILLIEAIPGKSSFKAWFKTIAVELLSFPLVVLFLLLARIMMQIKPHTGQIWRPPFLTDINPDSFTIILAAFFIFAIPNLIKAIKALLGVESGLGFGPGVFFAGATAAAGGVMGGFSKFSAFSQLPGVSSKLRGTPLGALLPPKAEIEKWAAEENERRRMQGQQQPQPQGGGGGGGGGPCLPPNTLISTIGGPVPIIELSIGDLIWTINENGTKKKAKIIQAIKRKVQSVHFVIKITLSDGRKVSASPPHPTTDYRSFENLKVGDLLDNAQIVKCERIKYNEKYVYDILPEGKTGFYIAEEVAIGSTLRKKTLNSQIRGFAKYLFQLL